MSDAPWDTVVKNAQVNVPRNWPGQTSVIYFGGQKHIHRIEVGTYLTLQIYIFIQKNVSKHFSPVCFVKCCKR